MKIFLALYLLAMIYAIYTQIGGNDERSDMVVCIIIFSFVSESVCLATNNVSAEMMTFPLITAITITLMMFIRLRNTLAAQYSKSTQESIEDKKGSA